jgi:hypothetical protein
VIPRGTEEGRTIELGGRTFNLMLGRPVQFPLFTSTADRVVSSGEIVTVEEDLHALPPIHSVLKNAEGKTGSIPVHLRAILTEIGTLELWCVSDGSSEQWRLEFELRGTTPAVGNVIIEPMPPRFEDAKKHIEQIFGGRTTSASDAGAKPKQVWRSLELTLGPREHWRLPILRELWSTLHKNAGRRRRSADHERIWFQLVGYTLRPGFGYPLDEWRCEQAAALFNPLVAFHKEKPVWIEFWIMWRRIAGGMSETRHLEIWNYLKPHLERRLALVQPKHQPKLKGIQPEGLDEMIRLAAALEHLDAGDKIVIGDWIAPRVASPGPWAWALGRLGARAPLYGSIHKAVPPEKAALWLELLLDAHSHSIEGALFAAVQVARLTGDRSRDLDDEHRNRVLTILRQANAPDAWQRLLMEVVTMEIADQARAFGDTLPAGLAA